MSRSTHLFAVCIASLFAVACADPALEGEPCTDSADCAVGLSCFQHMGAEVTPVCMADCDLVTTRLCDDGTVCTNAMGPPMGPERPADLGVCYLGGTTAVGSACMGNLECAAGSICVAIGDTQACFRACTTDDGAGCEATETCSALTGMGVNGFCQPTM